MSQNQAQNHSGQHAKSGQFDQLEQSTQKNGRKNESGIHSEKDVVPKFIDESIVDPRNHINEFAPKNLDSTKIPEHEFMKPGEGKCSDFIDDKVEVIDPRKDEDKHPPTNMNADSLLKHKQHKNPLSETYPLTDDQNSFYFHQESAASIKGESFRPQSSGQTSNNPLSADQNQQGDSNQTNFGDSLSQQTNKRSVNNQTASKQSNAKSDSESPGKVQGEWPEEVIKTDRNLSDMDNDTRSKYM